MVARWHTTPVPVTLLPFPPPLSLLLPICLCLLAELWPMFSIAIHFAHRYNEGRRHEP